MSFSKTKGGGGHRHLRSPLAIPLIITVHYVEAGRGVGGFRKKGKMAGKIRRREK